MTETSILIEKVRKGFASLNVGKRYQKQALKFLEIWLSNLEFSEYKDQIEYFIKNSDWDYLLDCFYQIIPFGTGGRRGEVGIGPNRINKWTIQASAQGHSQYLKKIYGDLNAKTRGVVLSYGIREYYPDEHYDNNLNNPVKNLKGVDLAYSAAQVYVANGIKTYIFESPRTTPELSFSVRYLKALAGDMFDASHNPPEHNGKKVYDEFGGQLIPPEDELLVKEVTQNVKLIKTIALEDLTNNDFLVKIGQEVDQAYISEVAKVSLSDFRNINIVYTPLHGVGSTSVLLALQQLNFMVESDPSTSFHSGKFENVTFNIPNPEVVQSFDTTLKFAKNTEADLILNSDPDADRIGVMVKDSDKWIYLNGNEIGVLLTDYVINKKKSTIKNGVIVKTTVTTNLSTIIAEQNNVQMIGELPVGFKYIGQEMNKLEKAGRISDFLLGIEESNGYIAGNYVRDKDASIAAVWLAELAAELKTKEKTLVDYLKEIYVKYGYFRNYLTEIRLPGAEGMEKIQKIQEFLRLGKIEKFGDYKIKKVEDFLDNKPIVSDTDKSSKDLIVFHLVPPAGYETMRVTVRPSGTEPKSKMYFEIGTKPFSSDKYELIKDHTENLLKNFEKAVMDVCYKSIGVNFPSRGFLLFWQIPLNDKLRYFEIESELAELKNVSEKNDRQQKVKKLLLFLGNDAIEKVDQAFSAKYNKSIREFLNI